MRSVFESRLRRAASKKKYCQSPNGKAKNKAYQSSPKRKEYFALYQKTPKALAYQKAYRGLKRKEISDRSRAYIALPHVKERMSRYAKQPKCKASQKAYRQSIRGKEMQLAFRQKPESKMKKSAYRKSPEGKAYYRAKNHYRRTLVAGAGGKFTAEQEKSLRDASNNQCVDCKGKDNLCLDHIIPVSLGGSSNIENYQILCRGCNSRKCAKLISKYITREVADEYVENHAQRGLPFDPCAENMLRSLNFLPTFCAN